MKSDDLKRVELRLQTADGLLRRNISTTRVLGDLRSCGGEHDCEFSRRTNAATSIYQEEEENDEQLESYSVKSAALDGAEKSTSSAEPGPAQAVTPKPDKTEPVHVPPEVPASALFTIDEPKQTRLLVLTTPNRSESCPLTFIDKPELAFQQSDFDLKPVSTTVENSSVSPVIVEHLASAETPADEIEAQEAEPPKNEPEPSSEDESNDGVLSPVEEPNNTTMHKPEMENKRIQYSRDFLLSIQFMPDCMQKPEGLPSIPDVVLHKCNQNKLPPDPQGLSSRDSNISNIPAGTGSSCFSQ
ncbi:hypothetical protein HF521_016872 [Silurus meridionalis]|uniref:Uncharacterized protein n=2 Tax=Silurus meridionalis TaxID=175797 RepID=A0A8T0BLK5_SILME|nr:hypothetical protein HF521_016872 [Silurus meridionalis]